MRFDTKSNSLKFLFLLISGDILYIVLHIGHLITTTGKTLVETGNSAFDLGKDLGLAESYMYVKEYWVILLLAYLAWTKKKLMYLAWCLLFFYIIFDDMLQLHERIGALIAKNFEMVSMFGLRAQDFGELSYTAFFGAVLLGLITIAYYKSDRDLRRICHHLLVLLMSLLLFGIVFDILQIMVLGNHIMFYTLGIIEDGGEMIILSLFCWYTYLLSEEETNVPPFNIL